MKILGIVAEYNPFHNGHAYLLDAAKQRVHPDYSIAVMSGNFLQRGEVALFDKYKRSQMAILGGLDAVFELPVYYASSSGEEFATAAVITMKHLSVTHLAFGAECDDLALLKELAAITVSEDEAFKTYLRERISAGDTYAQAYSYAMCQCVTTPDIMDIISQPNNILALCYLRAILRHCPDIEAVLIPRREAMYHDTRIHGSIASASAIRKRLTEHGISDELKVTLPYTTNIHLPEKHSQIQYLTNQDLTQIFAYAILSHDETQLSEIYDISIELANRMSGLSPVFSDYDTLVDALKTKQYTRTRISRSLIHLLLTMRQDTFLTAKEKGYIFYVRLLGFSKASSQLIKHQKMLCPVPFIQKVSEAEKSFDEGCNKDLCRLLFQTDLHASDLYRLSWYHKYGDILPDDYRTNALII